MDNKKLEKYYEIYYRTIVNNTKKDTIQTIKNYIEFKEILSLFRHGDGSCRVWIIDQSRNTGIETITLNSDSHKYLITAYGYTEAGDEVLSLHNPNPENLQISILGEQWDLSMITLDFNIINKIFKKFFELGDVPRNILY
ncbi:DUF6911 family protein [Paralysiella testudinis]|uniref:Uncharacterized protein n=1 Tax=Paralysiella testudinis TaxID=2809020 RepID=A0A892ZMV8_9NEIS|nr:hypothetical protein [Paralysiella testudinis]QRQ82189.1 hypothetical protein JQU52_01790 [Paralysiella testudinis]